MSNDMKWINDHIDKMGTRKNPVHFGRVITNVIGTKYSNDENSYDSNGKLLNN